jgi:hypothetical protein
MMIRLPVWGLILGTDEREWILDQHLDVEIPAVRCHEGNAEGYGAVMDERADLGRGVVVDPEHHIRVTLLEAPQRLGQAAGRDGGKASDRQGFLAAAPLMAELVQRTRKAFDGLLHLGQKIEAGLGQRDLAGGPGQKLHAKVLFELADPVAEGRLR